MPLYAQNDKGASIPLMIILYMKIM